MDWPSHHPENRIRLELNLRRLSKGAGVVNWLIRTRQENRTGITARTGSSKRVSRIDNGNVDLRVFLT
jgi:hypothetical protein